MDLPSVQPAKGRNLEQSKAAPSSFEELGPALAQGSLVVLVWDHHLAIFLWSKGCWACPGRRSGQNFPPDVSPGPAQPLLLVQTRQERSAVRHVPAVLYQEETGWECMDALGCVQQFSPL